MRLVQEKEYKEICNRIEKIIGNNEAFISSFIKRLDADFILRRPKYVICDCDGVLTDGTSEYTKDGKSSKTYGAYDKELIKIFEVLGFNFIFFTADGLGEDIHKKRLNDLGFDLLHGNFNDRIKKIEELRTANPNCFTIYIGDSLSDMSVGNEADVFCTTNNAPSFVKQHAEYVSKSDGGSGGLSELLLNILSSSLIR